MPQTRIAEILRNAKQPLERFNTFNAAAEIMRYRLAVEISETFFRGRDEFQEREKFLRACGIEIETTEEADARTVELRESQKNWNENRPFIKKYLAWVKQNETIEEGE